MSTVTGTLMVNAAFLQEIKEDAREFRQLLCQAVEMLGPAQAVSVNAKQLVELLGKLRDQLALHFTLEEAYGYFEDAIDAAPQLSEKAESLRGQHQPLFADMVIVFEQAEQLLREEPPAGQRAKVAKLFHKFRTDLQTHEARENELICAAFNDDVGCGD